MTADWWSLWNNDQNLFCTDFKNAMDKYVVQTDVMMNGFKFTKFVLILILNRKVAVHWSE